MAVFCYKCGERLKDSSKFCPACGTPIRRRNPAPAAAEEAAAPKSVCAFCGTELRASSKFCAKCGRTVQAAQKQTDQQLRQPPQPNPVYVPPQPVQADHVRSYFASDKAGEVLLGMTGINTNLSAGKVITSKFRELPKKLGGIFKDPKKLLPVLGLTVIWLLVYLLRAFGLNGFLVKALSFLSFAGTFSLTRPLAVLGGLVGKGIFAAAVISLIGLLSKKKTPQQAQPRKRSFGGLLGECCGVSGNTVWGWLAGIGAALVIYCFISGGNGLMSVMGGASAAFLAGRASIGSGFVRQFISSLRINNAKSLEGVTRGMAAGFAGAAVIGVFSFLFAALLINGIILLLGGGTMLTLQLTGVIKPKAKEAGTL